jgi:hypothetical protein
MFNNLLVVFVYNVVAGFIFCDDNRRWEFPGCEHSYHSQVGAANAMIAHVFDVESVGQLFEDCALEYAVLTNGEERVLIQGDDDEMVTVRGKDRWSDMRADMVSSRFEGWSVKAIKANINDASVIRMEVIK